MIEDLASLKAATIGRGGSRAREEYVRALDTFSADLPARDAANLNILHACEVMLGTGQHPIYRERLCARQNTRKLLMIVPMLLRGHGTQPLPWLAAEHPELGLPC
jgi:hypothetical protein